MWKVDNMINTYGESAEYLNILQYAQSINVKYDEEDKCTINKLTSDLPSEMSECSSLKSCGNNNDCIKPYETCGIFPYRDSDGSDKFP